jgi:hypothetical protein
LANRSQDIRSQIAPLLVFHSSAMTLFPSIRHLERRAILRPRPPMIVNARRRDVRMPQPFLHFGNIGLVIERIGGGSCPQRMGADLKPKQRRIRAHQPVDAISGDRIAKLAGAVVAGWAEQRTIFIGAVPGDIEIVMDQGMGAGMQRHITGFAAFAGHPEMRHAFAGVPEILDL